MASSGGDGKWQTVKAKDKNRKPKDPSAKSGTENGGVSVTMPVFAALDREQGPKAKAAQRHAASISPESRSGETLGQSESSPDGRHSSSPNSEKKAKTKKPKAKKLSPKDAGPSLPSAAAFKDTLRGVREQYKYQEQAQLGRLADIFGNAYKEAELPFNKLITEGPLEKVTDIPLRDCPTEMAAAAMAFIAEMETRPVAKFLLSLLEEYFEGVPETNGKTPVPKAKVGLLLSLSLVLRAVPASLFVISDEILQMGDKWTGTTRLPYLLWVFNQAARGKQGMGVAMWVRVILPQLLGGHLPSTKTKSVWHNTGPVSKMGPASAQKALLYLEDQLKGMLSPSSGAKQVVAPGTGHKKDVTVSMTVDCSTSSLPSLVGPDQDVTVSVCFNQPYHD